MKCFHVTFAPSAGPDQAAGCVQDIDVDNRKRLYEAVMLSGGSTMFPGLPTRLARDVRQLYLDRVLKVSCAPLPPCFWSTFLPC